METNLAQKRTVPVMTKKTLRTSYHLASFNKPISKDACLPDHIIEQAAPTEDSNSQYASAADLVRSENRKQYGQGGFNYPMRGRGRGQQQFSQPYTTQLVHEQRRNREVKLEEKTTLVYEEKSTGRGDPQKFYGKRHAYKSAEEKNDVPNYAFLIHDKKKNCFRLVPIHSHIQFQKALPRAQETSAPVQQAPDLQNGLPPLKPVPAATTNQPAKKATNKSFLQNIRKQVNQQNKQLIQTTNRTKKPQVKSKKNNNNSDNNSDSEGGGSGSAEEIDHDGARSNDSGLFDQESDNPKEEKDIDPFADDGSSIESEPEQEGNNQKDNKGGNDMKIQISRTGKSGPFNMGGQANGMSKGQDDVNPIVGQQANAEAQESDDSSGFASCFSNQDDDDDQNDFQTGKRQAGNNAYGESGGYSRQRR